MQVKNYTAGENNNDNDKILKQDRFHKTFFQY